MLGHDLSDIPLTQSESRSNGIFTVHEGEEEELQKARILPVRAPAVHCRARLAGCLDSVDHGEVAALTKLSSFQSPLKSCELVLEFDS